MIAYNGRLTWSLIVTLLHARVHSAPAHSALVDCALVRSVLVHCAVETVVVGLEFQVIDELAGTRAAARGPDAHTARGRLSLRSGYGHARVAACLPVARLRRTSDAVWLVSCAPRTLHHRTSKLRMARLPCAHGFCNSSATGASDFVLPQCPRVWFVCSWYRWLPQWFYPAHA